jgi:eukaryotic-like serine/threonine-protein kinase
MKQHSLCSDEQLRFLLQSDSDEGSAEFHSASTHVDHCDTCQTRLGELAAEDGEWDEAHEMLVAVNEIREQGDSQPRTGSWYASRWQRRPTAWTESMARQILNPPSHPEMLGRIGRYEVERLIGAGGMGVVFKAFDTELNRPVAIKVLAPFLAGSGAARQRFAREARAAAAVVHEHVVAIHNVETDEESPFLVMPFVAGDSLQTRLDRDGALDVCEILRIGMQTASGLAAAHAQGLVHRDVKPSNILLEEGVERTLLTDFGLAQANDDASLTHTGYHPGTPQYMSPEQARGDTVDARSDLFSFGSVLYTMCTGRPPFRAETSYGILRRITDNEPRPLREINPSIPIWLEGIVQKLQAKSPADRFQTAADVAELLEECLAHVQQPTTVKLPAECRRFSLGRPIRITRRHVLLSASIVVCGALAFTFGPDRSNNSIEIDEGIATVPAPDPAAKEATVVTSESDTMWDGTAVDIESFGQDLKTFESRAGSLWNTQPETATTESQLDTP